jgi:hypothetical protein
LVKKNEKNEESDDSLALPDGGGPARGQIGGLRGRRALGIYARAAA